MSKILGVHRYSTLQSVNTVTLTALSGNYIPSPNILYLKVKMVGPGGGGSGSGTGGGAGTSGSGNATFSTFLTCTSGGGGNVAGIGGVPGDAFVITSPTVIKIFAESGAYGGVAEGNSTVPVYTPGGDGANSPFAGRGVGSQSAGAAATGYGSGGGGSGSGANTVSNGSGGGSGGYLEVLILGQLAISYAYTNGNGGTGGTSGSGGGVGGNGAQSVIVIEEHFV